MPNEVDHDAIAHAQATLAGRRPSPAQKVQAYRTLAAWKPKAYALRLAEALREQSWSTHGGRLDLLREAATFARLAQPATTQEFDVVVDVLDSFQFALYEAHLREEGLAVCEELGALANRPDGGTRRGLNVWACRLAESGRHAEAADICIQTAVKEPPGDGTAWSWHIWGLIEAVSQARLAGRTALGNELLARVVDTQRAFVVRGDGQERVLLHLLLHQAWVLDADGQIDGSTAAGREALELLAQIVAAGGECRKWSGYQSTLWTTLLAASTATIERGSDTPALPAFGWPITNWSPDLRDAYCAGVEKLEVSVPALTEPTSVAHARRQIAIRTAVCREWRSGTPGVTYCRPVFNNSVDAARRQFKPRAASTSVVLAQALVDRAGLAAVDSQFDLALNDLTEAMQVRGGSGNPKVEA